MNRSNIWSYLQSYPVLFGVLGTLWGGSFVAIEVGLHAMPPLLFAGLRYAIAGTVVMAFALATTERWRPRSRDDWQAVAVAGVLVVAVYQALLFTGEQYVSGAVAAIVVSLSPVLSAGFAALLVPGQGLDRSQYAGVGLGFLGVVLVVDPLGASASLVGVGLVVAGMTSFSLGSVLVRPLSPSLPARSLQAWAMLVGSTLLLGGSVVRGESVPTTWSPTALASLAYLSLLSGAVAYLVYFSLLDRVGAAELNLVAYVEPMVAAAASWVLLDQGVGATTLLGFLTILAGFAVVKRDGAGSLAKTLRRRARRLPLPDPAQQPGFRRQGSRDAGSVTGEGGRTRSSDPVAPGSD